MSRLRRWSLESWRCPVAATPDSPLSDGAGIAKARRRKPVSQLQEAFGEPRKIDKTSTKWVYVWFVPQKPAGAPTGFHGCEMEVAVDARSQRVLGYSLSNIGWSNCGEVERRIRVAER